MIFNNECLFVVLGCHYYCVFLAIFLQIPFIATCWKLKYPSLFEVPDQHEVDSDYPSKADQKRGLTRHMVNEDVDYGTICLDWNKHGLLLCRLFGTFTSWTLSGCFSSCERVLSSPTSGLKKSLAEYMMRLTELPQISFLNRLPSPSKMLNQKERSRMLN